MAFDFYFTGVSANSDIADFLIEKEACVLLSQLNERNNIYKWINRLKDSKSRCKLFIDSGAFSAWTKGKSIDIEEYINFINTYKDYFYVCASVDNIPGEPRSAHVASEEEVKQSSKKTWDNFLYMREAMDNPDILLCTFHCGEPWELLKEILDYEDERGKIKYLGLGGLVGKTEAIIDDFFEKAFMVIKESKNPDIKVHAFGMTRLNYLNKYPFTSADSTSWLQTANFGNIIIDSKTVCLSDRKLMSDDNIINKSIAVKDSVAEITSKYGYTIEDLSQDTNKRLMFNVKSLWEWAGNYKYVPKETARKVELF